jgi:hypothetical protein
MTKLTRRAFFGGTVAVAATGTVKAAQEPSLMRIPVDTVEKEKTGIPYIFSGGNPRPGVWFNDEGRTVGVVPDESAAAKLNTQQDGERLFVLSVGKPFRFNAKERAWIEYREHVG